MNGRAPGAPAEGEASLDQLLESLEAVLQRLADPSAPLDRAVADYEQARGLLDAAERRLEAARSRIALAEPRAD
jgi:exodeoxyribonuclease VII small subunit